VRSVFVFSWDVELSPMREALAGADVGIRVFGISGGRPLCPITAPPQLAILEPEPERPVAPLLHNAADHPVIGRVPQLVVLDLQWLSMAHRLATQDFILRDFRPAEAIARVYRLVGRRDAETAPLVLQFDGLTVDIEGFEVRTPSETLALTPQEFALLSHLARHAGRVQSREALLQRVWGRSYHGGARTVDIHVARLRAKLGERYAQRVRTVRGVGYKWQS
jgi:hypothetical protein